MTIDFRLCTTMLLSQALIASSIIYELASSSMSLIVYLSAGIGTAPLSCLLFVLPISCAFLRRPDAQICTSLCSRHNVRGYHVYDIVIVKNVLSPINSFNTSNIC